MGVMWGLGSWLVGAAFIAAGFLAQNHTTLSKSILFIGSAILILSGLSSSMFFAPLGRDMARAFVEFVPPLLGIVAGFTIGPIQRSMDEIRAQQSGVRMPPQPVPPEQQVPFDNERAA